jgi:hypothetical protein
MGLNSLRKLAVLSLAFKSIEVNFKLSLEASGGSAAHEFLKKITHQLLPSF